jgi:hypothetical protein
MVMAQNMCSCDVGNRLHEQVFTIILYIILQVVDARAGPGTKSLTKFKSKNKKKLKLKPDGIQKVEKLIKKKHIYMKNDRSGREESPGALSDDITGNDD